MAKKTVKKSAPISFNASEVNLQKRNLIEASAGTGKTYSIAILVLRLIIEKNFSVKEILMVTYTKAAVAELEERIRLFVKTSFAVAKNDKVEDTTIKEIVTRNIKTLGHDVVFTRLQEAVLSLDESSVLTIHSFCQNALSEFAFETDQLFDAEAISDLSEITLNEVNQFWRTYITTIEIDLLSKILESLNRADIFKITNQVLSGKEFLTNLELIDDLLINHHKQTEVAEAMDTINELYLLKKEEFFDFIINNSDLLRERTSKNKNATASFMKAIDDPEEFLLVFEKKYSTNYVQSLYPDLVLIFNEIQEVLVENQKFKNKVVYSIYTLSIPIITGAIQQIKKEKNIITFDDMIYHLHQAVTTKTNEPLYKALQQKYKAVFVDEFQDTDKLQYEIFDTVFKAPTVLFFIGDPKQSIYSFRKADIFTYFKAGKQVDHQYGMDVNYRSSVNYIDAMNVFFKPETDFDPFCFNGSANAVDYIQVSSPKKNNKGELYYNKKPVIPIEISESDNNNQIIYKTASIVSNLLGDKKYEIRIGTNHRAVLPSDIGIIVRTNRQGKEIKKALTQLGIHAITIDDSKLLSSEEAIDILYVLQAIHENSRANISKALLSCFTSYTREEIVNLSDEELLIKFRTYKQNWESDGAYVALHLFLKEFNVKSVLMNRTQGGDRQLSNVLQLIELLHKVQQFKTYNPSELIHWLHSNIESNSSSENEFIQRMESDEDALKIVTIHKSKGLEYNIVLAPHLDLNSTNDYEDGSFRDDITEIYYYGYKALFESDQLDMLQLQTQQENRRLLYVALTRAVYKCYVFKNNYFSNSALSPFVNALKSYKGSLIAIENEIPDAISANQKPIWKPFQSLKINTLKLVDTNWRKLSYSAIVAPHEYHPKDNHQTCADEYDQFIFKTLPKGAQCGNMLHYIFENIAFDDESTYEYVIKKALYQFFPSKVNAYKDDLLQLVKKTLQSKITINGHAINLATLNNKQKLNELEFDFHVNEFQLKQLTALSTNERQFEVKDLGEIKGWLNGKIDLFFEYEGKYYIIDWKSNFLGDTIDYYNQEHLANAMNENNYHLQYLIYTLAVKKYLSKRLPNFDYDTQLGGVVYLFLRGLRNGNDNGVYVYRPKEKEIEGMEKLVSS
jgi:exodeoxyribonuclease V beta subunit